MTDTHNAAETSPAHTVTGELVPLDVAPEPARDEAGERWARELELVRQWLDSTGGNTRSGYADAIGWPYNLATGEFRPDHGTQFRGGATWLAWCARNRVHLLDANREHVRQWAKDLRAARSVKSGRALSPGTVAHTFTAASSLHTWLMQEGHVQANPMAQVNRKNLGVKLHKGPSPTRSLSENEAGKLLAAADNDWVESSRLRSSALVAFLLDMGVRVEEALSMRLEKIDFVDEHRVVWVTLKGGKPHPVALPPEVGERVDAYLASRGIGSAVALRGRRGVSPFLFATSNETRMARKEVATLLARLAERAGIADPKKVTPHVLRHSHVTAARRAGVDGDTLRRHMGHAQIATTDRYGHHVLDLANSPALKTARAFEQAAERFRGSSREEGQR